MGWGTRGTAARLRRSTIVVASAFALAATAIAPASAAVRKPAVAKAPLPGWVVDRVRFEPLTATAGSAATPVAGTPAGFAVTDAGRYRGTIDVAHSPSGGGVGVVDTLPLDAYLRGISEVPASWPIEAQKAQAIAARTYALYELRLRTNTAYKALGADICATDSCQVFAGLAKEEREGSEAWTAAVQETAGQVLWYRNGPIKAKYSSSNGGRSVAGDEPYLRAVDDPDDAQSPLHQWHLDLGLADVARVLGVPGDPVDLHRDGDDIVVTTTAAAATTTTAAGDGGGAQSATAAQETRLAAADFRSRVNSAFPAPAGMPLPLPSVRFGAGTTDGVISIDGRGWGHGIGLSQYGALGKALRGMKAPDILAAYYAGLRPVVVPAELLPAQVRVAVALDEGQAGVSALDPGAVFRVTDSAGNVLAPAATGAWQVVPAPHGRVRVVPPPPDPAPAAAAAAPTAVEPTPSATDAAPPATPATPPTQLAVAAIAARRPPAGDRPARPDPPLPLDAAAALAVAGVALATGRTARTKQSGGGRRHRAASAAPAAGS